MKYDRIRAVKEYIIKMNDHKEDLLGLRGLFFLQTYMNSTLEKDAFRIIIALVAHYDLELHQMDVNIAFLNGNLVKEVSMLQPEGFKGDGKNHLVDRCIYLRTSGSKFIFLILYVDDIVLASIDLRMLQEIKKLLSRQFEMKDLGEASYVLGIAIQGIDFVTYWDSLKVHLLIEY
ncbi:Uncharacterized protein TCM_019713 [Theobroma cacao]|uniref:Reverse transcriptase Ty1/copia-type domain-containing protein n=1 Tax=Theobroma cacao TaxID=3641 RepID=A0A061EII0_THECC|nr:Uncharacterized protein TCM_019713 [Theobroma cacao]